MVCSSGLADKYQKRCKAIIQVLIAVVIGTMTSYPAAGQQIDTSLDSLLEKLHLESRSLITERDSVMAADSLAEQYITRQIANVDSLSQFRLPRLRGSLDSIQRVAAEHRRLLEEQANALRSRAIGIPVVLEQDTLFSFYAKIGPFSARDRAMDVNKRIKEVANSPRFDTAYIVIRVSDDTYDIMHQDLHLLSITDRDAFWLDLDKSEIARAWLAILKEKIPEYRLKTGAFRMIRRIGFVLLVLFVFVFGVRYISRWLTWLNNKILKKSKKHFKGVKFRDYEFLSIERQEQFTRWVLDIIKWVLIVVFIYLALPIAFSIFPATKTLATTLFGYILTPLKTIGLGIIGYIPELITIIIIVVVTRYFVRFLHFLALEVQEGKLDIPGFYSEWAIPTFNLLKIAIYAFAFIIIFPYLPGSNSPVFLGVSIFFGLLITLGSSSAVGNIIAGLVITYMRAFKLGDRVKIGDSSGDVIEKNLLVTRIRTIKNEEVTIPNSSILNGTTINYTSSAKELGLILNTTVTLGYEVPWRQAEHLLIEAAKKTDLVDDNPPPFALQVSLDEWYVTYQINAYTRHPEKTAVIYSNLHANIQDLFGEAGIELLTPQYESGRDGSPTTIPGKRHGKTDSPEG